MPSIVVRHLHEGLHDPALVHSVAVEAAAHVVANPAARHAGERLLDYLARPVEAGVPPARQQELAGGGVWELGGGAEAPVADVEEPRHLVGGLLDQARRHLARARLVERLGHVLADRRGVLRDLVAIAAVGVRDLPQHRDEAGPPETVLLGREIRASEEHLALGSQERRERPASLSGDGLDGALIAGVHVWALVAVHLHADELTVQDLGDGRILVRLAVHHVAPVAPHGADVEQHRLVLGARGREGLFAPRAPVDRLVGGGLEVGGRLRREAVHTRELGHRSRNTHTSHRGRRAMHTVRPCRISMCENTLHLGRGTSGMRSRWIFTGSSWRVSLSSRVMRCTCVSTTTPSFFPNQVPRMTLAVLRPTPGRATSASIVSGTLPPCRSTSAWAMPMIDFVLLRKNPVLWISRSSTLGSALA